MRTLFTIHNIAYQGMFPHELFHLTGLDFRLALAERLEDAGSTTSGSMALPTGLRAQIWTIRLATVALVVGVIAWWLVAGA